MVLSRFIENENNACHPIDINVKMSKEKSLTKNSIQKLVNNNTGSSGTFKQSIKYPEVEDIEIFQEQQIKIQSSLKKRHRHNRHHTKTHKSPAKPVNSTEYHFTESRDRLKIRTEEIQSGRTDTVNVIPHYTLLRSSTLPNFQTVTKDTETKVMDLPVQSLRHAPFLRTSYDILNHDKLVGEEYNVRLRKQLSERLTHKRCRDPNVPDSNATLKSQSCVKDVTSLTEQEKGLSDIAEASTVMEHTPASNIRKKVACAPHGVQPSLEKETDLLIKEDKIKHESGIILHLEKETGDESSNNFNRSGNAEEQNKDMEQHNSLVSDDDTLQVQNIAIVTAGECHIHAATHVCCETSHRGRKSRICAKRNSI
jgi:hypothetical protein